MPPQIPNVREIRTTIQMVENVSSTASKKKMQNANFDQLK